MSYSWCPCCRGETEFDWFEDACDECAAAILGGQWTEFDHPHRFSERQVAAIECEAGL